MSTPGDAPRPDIIDYEGSRYRSEFWEDANRDYEDRVERGALRRLLPGSGHRLLEVGAGYGRLTPEYQDFDQIVLLDYSLTHLQDAQERLGRKPQYVYVAADVCQQPFCTAAFDAATTIRVLHHLPDVPGALAEMARVLEAQGKLVLEHASKRHVKSVLRHAFGLQTWSPYTLEPLEFVPLNFDFHPEYMRRTLTEVGFNVGARLPVSWLRLGLLKRWLPTGLLVGVDSLLQRQRCAVEPQRLPARDAGRKVCSRDRRRGHLSLPAQWRSTAAGRGYHGRGRLRPALGDTRRHLRFPRATGLS